MPDAKRRRERIQATTLNEKQLRTFIRVLAGPRTDQSKTGRFGKLHELIRVREDHFFNREAADQKLQAPHDDVTPYQTDLPRRTWVKLKARLVENPYRIRVEPDEDSETQRKIANQIEKALQTGLNDLEERHDFVIQEDLSDGQIIHCYGVLHWTKQSDIWPNVPDLEERDDEPEDAKQKKRFRKGRRRGEKKFVETDDSLLERDTAARAKAGFPFYLEVPRADVVSFIADRSSENGLGMVLTMRTVPMVEFAEKLERDDGLKVGTIAVNQHMRALRIYQERERPASWEPSGSDPLDWGREVVVAQLWTRDEFYELVAMSQGGALGASAEFRLVKSSKHPYGMPPYSFAWADKINHPDPALAYAPSLEGVFRLKPFFDHDMTLGRAIAEQIALPFYYVKLEAGGFMSDDAGKRLVFSRNALAAEALPAGATIESISPDMNVAVVEFLNRSGEEMAEAAPESGFVEISTSTQPWSIRLAQAQASIELKKLVVAQARAIRTAVRNIAHVIALPLEEGGFGRPVPVRVGSEVIEIEPEDLGKMTIEVDINPESSAQTIATIEHGREWLADPNVPLERHDFAEDFMHIAGDVDEKLDRYDAEQIYLTMLRPGVIRQELARRFSEFVALGPGGSLIGFDGQELTPEQLLGAQGTPGDVVAESQPTLPALPGLAGNGAGPLAGTPG